MSIISVFKRANVDSHGALSWEFPLKEFDWIKSLSFNSVLKSVERYWEPWSEWI